MFRRKTVESIPDSPYIVLLRSEIEIQKDVPITRVDKLATLLLGQPWLSLKPEMAYRWMEGLEGLDSSFDLLRADEEYKAMLRLNSGSRGSRVDLHVTIDNGLPNFLQYRLKLPIGRKPQIDYEITEDEMIAPFTQRYRKSPDEQHLHEVLTLVRFGIQRP